MDPRVKVLTFLSQQEQNKVHQQIISLMDDDNDTVLDSGTQPEPDQAGGTTSKSLLSSLLGDQYAKTDHSSKADTLQSELNNYISTASCQMDKSPMLW